jgi:hypothetical protein
MATSTVRNSPSKRSSTAATLPERAEADRVALEIDGVRFPEKYAAKEEPAPEPKEALTFTRFWRERYTPTLTTDAPSTREAKSNHFTRNLEPVVGDRQLGDITVTFQGVVLTRPVRPLMTSVYWPGGRTR